MVFVTLKDNPVLVSLFTVILFIATLLIGGISGWFIRAALESKAELSVVVDDGVFTERLLKVLTPDWIQIYNKKQDKFYEDHKDIPDCLSKPLPKYYYDNDYGLQSNRK